jgi:cell division protein FtsL
MGVPARRIEANPFAHRSNHLHLVTTPPAPVPSRTRPASAMKKKATQAAAPKGVAASAKSRARTRAAEARAKAAFTAFLAVFVFAVVLGGARVTLVVQAAEAAVVESRVAAAMKAQRAEVDQLEVDKSALSTPSRIAGIAAASMDMGEPESVRYLSVPEAAPQTHAGAGVAASGSTDVVSQVFGAVMELSAGEAQSLLVGDLGLAGSR